MSLKAEFCKELGKIFRRAIAKLLSHKAWIFGIATWLVYKEKISEYVWLAIAMSFFAGKVVQYFIHAKNGGKSN